MNITRIYDNNSKINPTKLLLNSLIENKIDKYISNLYTEIEINLATTKREVV